MRLPVPSNLQTLARVAAIAGHDVACTPLPRLQCHPFVVPLTASGSLVRRVDSDIKLMAGE
jgi:hypothetical protein